MEEILVSELKNADDYTRVTKDKKMWGGSWLAFNQSRFLA